MTTSTVPRETLMHVMKTMPAAPQVLSRLRKMTQDPDVDMGDIAALLKCDPALTARIIRVANSPVYCVGSEYSSLEQALARVGMSEIYTIAGFAAVVQMTNQNLRLYGITGAELRENSLLTALIMEALAKQIGIDAQEAYSAGLLRSIGKIALEGLTYSSGLLRSQGSLSLGSVAKSGAHKVTYDPVTGGALGEWETGLVGFSNCDAAAFILAEWRFPDAMTSAIGSHYAPEGDAANPVLSNLLNVAAGAADTLGFGLAGEQGYWSVRTERMAAVGVDAQQLEDASTRGLERFCALHTAVS
jgi:HD-like signal output (HDOD) protein